MFISEPATMLTDYALALLCARFALSLHHRSAGWKMSLWITAFSVIALAALAGGTAHGFRIPLGDAWALVRAITVLFIALGAALLITAGIRSGIYPETPDGNARRIGRRWLKRAVAISLVGLVVLALKLSLHPGFNHNDLYHLIQMGGLYSLYRGSILLGGLGSTGQGPKT